METIFNKPTPIHRLCALSPEAPLFIWLSSIDSSARITKARSDESFLVYPKYEAVTGWRGGWLKKEWGGIKKEKILTQNGGVTVCPPCFEPAFLAGLSWFVERWENSFQKTRMFFGRSGSRNIRKQIIFSLTIPPPSWKEMCGDNPPPEETDWITLLPVFHPSDSLL